MPGMSGAPVRRLRDDVVVGVVSGRYNSADGWLRDTVWVARCERLRALCADVAPLALETKPVVAPIDLLLTVDAEQVHLAGADVDVRAEHGGVSPGLVNAVDETRRARANAGAQREIADDIASAPGRVALDRAGRLLSQSFLPAPVADALSERLEHAEHAHQPLRLGVACAHPALARLPWEALADPRTDGPLALRPLVSVHRRVRAGTPAPVPGPLRILVAISSPDESGGPLLDYERELRNVLTAVGAARDGSAPSASSRSPRRRRSAPRSRSTPSMSCTSAATARRAASCSSTTMAASGRSTPTRSSRMRFHRAACPPSSRSPRAIRTSAAPPTRHRSPPASPSAARRS